MTRTARKSKAVSERFKTSALDSARRAGIVGAYAGPPDLAANRKRCGFSISRGRRPITADTVRRIEARDDEA